MLFDILVLIAGVVALLATIFDWQLVALRIAIAVLFMLYSLASFPYPKEDRHKIGLAIGCVIFLVSGLASIATGSWWPLPVGLILGWGLAVLFGKFSSRCSPMSELEAMARDLSQIPGMDDTVEEAVRDIERENEKRKATLRELMPEIERLSDLWDREAAKWESERAKMISDFRARESAALANAKSSEVRKAVQAEYAQEEQELIVRMNARVADIDTILADMNRKKDAVSQLLDPLELEMIKQRAKGWRE